MLGKIFKYTLVILLGMLIGAAAILAAEYFIVTKTKVGTIKGAVPAIGEYVGDSLNDYTLIEAVQKLSASDTTIGQYTEYLPFLNDVLEGLAQDETVKKFVTLDLDKIKTYTFSQLGSNIGSAISVTASLGSISESFGFTLPDLPLFTTKETFVKITGEDFSVANAYYKDKTESIYYIEEDAYVNAYAGGVLVDSAKEKALYFKSAGIMEIPVTDAVSSLSETLGGVNNMTIDELNADFGVDLIGDNELVAKIVHGDDTLSSIADNFSARVDALTLEGDLGIDLTGTTLENIVGENCTVGEGESNPILKALFEKNATVGNISATMNELTVGDIYEIKGFIDASVISEETMTSEDVLRYKNFRCFTRSGDAATGYTYTECEKPTGEYGEGEYFKLDKNTGIWLLLMYEKSGTAGAFSYKETGDIKIVDLADTIQTGIRNNMETSTLQELYEIGFLSAVPNESIKNYTLRELVEMVESFPGM